MNDADVDPIRHPMDRQEQAAAFAGLSMNPAMAIADRLQAAQQAIVHLERVIGEQGSRLTRDEQIVVAAVRWRNALAAKVKHPGLVEAVEAELRACRALVKAVDDGYPVEGR